MNAAQLRALEDAHTGKVLHPCGTARQALPHQHRSATLVSLYRRGLLARTWSTARQHWVYTSP